MSRDEMNGPHVERLFYRVILSENTDYDKAPPISGETEHFKWCLGKDRLLIEMKTHCTKVEEAKEIVDEFLLKWEISIGLLYGPSNFRFKFHSSSVIDLSPTPESGNQALRVMGSGGAVVGDQADVHVSYAQLPAPYSNFDVSAQVEMMYRRFKLYQQGRDSLLAMAYWCLTVMEYSAGGRQDAADMYQVDSRVFRKLGELCSNRGDEREARKMNGNAGTTPLKPAEQEWIGAVVKRLILRVGVYAYDPVAKLQILTMADFPTLQ